jgi:hypothetical protein
MRCTIPRFINFMSLSHKRTFASLLAPNIVFLKATSLSRYTIPFLDGLIPVIRDGDSGHREKRTNRAAQAWGAPAAGGEASIANEGREATPRPAPAVGKQSDQRHQRI